MDNNSLQTSFIPKKPLSESPAVVVHHHSSGILYFISIFLLILSIVSAIGLYLYKNILNNQIAGLQQSLATAKSSFEPDTIANLQLFNSRLSVSNQLLASHTVFSPFFTLLGTLTIPSIQYKQFDVEQSSDGKSFAVKMSGVARDYKSIALQAQVFNSNQGNYFKNVVFSNLALSIDPAEKGYVDFNVSFDVDPTLISYEKQISNYSTQSATPPLTPSQ